MGESEKRVTPDDRLTGLEKRVNDLQMLIDVSAIISSTLDLNELTALVMEKAKHVMRADACSILLFNHKTGRLEFDVAMGSDARDGEILKRHVTLGLGEGIAGWVAENCEPVLVEHAARDDRFFSRADDLTGFTTKSLIAVPLLGRGGLLGVAEILNPRERDSFSGHDLELFQALCRQVAVAMENALYHKDALERQRLRQELELAATIQRSFLPDTPVKVFGQIRLSGFTLPARHVGGDLYDFVEPLPGMAGIFIGDVSGKGVSAALFMAKVMSDFRYQAHGTADPGLVLRRLNQQLSDTPRGMFLTAIYAIADQRSGAVALAVAGHPPFLHITPAGVTVVNPDAGPPAGIMDTDFPVTDLILSPGDRLIMMTDGAFDAKDGGGKRLCFDDIVSFAVRNGREDRLTDLIAGFVTDFTGAADRADDLTIVEMRYGI
ncbi:MAG: GAF domain-containing protein [Nitrospirae bacterium]|nr:GAF domain-containing protein [Nitrospirota bacterium]